MCFSHLNIPTPDPNQSESVPWWLAFVIAVPLAIISIAVIKIAHICYDKQQPAQPLKNSYSNL